jgi:hypothetical protein
MLGEAANNNAMAAEPAAAMRIFIFRSEARPDLHAFGAELDSGRLPKQFRPWRAIGAVAPSGTSPHELSREVIEEAIRTQGFQLWRIGKKD